MKFCIGIGRGERIDLERGSGELKQYKTGQKRNREKGANQLRKYKNGIVNTMTLLFISGFKNVYGICFGPPKPFPP
jgi:hypothetical protein